MQALTLNELKQPLQLQTRPDLSPAAGEAVVELRAAALNRRDYWITQGMYPGIQLPIVLGSDGAGVVIQVGTAEDEHWVEKPVLINPGMGWGDVEAFQSSQFTILGLPRDGTFASQVAVPVAQLYPLPEHLNWEQAAALPLAGVTAYRALFTQGGLRSEQHVLVTGIGGGVATMAMQLALAIGAKVWVTSSSPEKIQRAVDAGAEGGFDYRQAEWPKELNKAAGEIHLIIDGAGGRGYGALIDCLTPGGRIVNYGATAGAPEKLDLFKVFWKQVGIQGSTMGSPRDFAAMLDVVARYQIRPLIDHVYPLPEGNHALQKLNESSQFGKVVLTAM